jgi:hypothetical protein
MPEILPIVLILLTSAVLPEDLLGAEKVLLTGR